MSYLFGVDWRGGKDDPPCEICGRRESEHHEFKPIIIPESCVCDPEDWGSPYDIPPVCNNYETYEDDCEGVCKNCEHKKGVINNE